MDSGGGYRCPWLFLLVGCVCSGWQSMCAIVSAIRQLPPNRGERWAKLQPCFLSARQIPWSVNRNARESFMSEFKVTIESPDVRKQAEVLMKELDEEGKRNAGSDS